MPNSKKKVLVVAPCPFFIDRGTPIRIKRLAEAAAKDYEVHVATFGQGRDDVFPFIIHRTWQLPLSITRSGANLAKLLYDILLLFVVIRVAIKEKITLIDGHLHEGALIGWLAKCLTLGRIERIVYNAHGTFVPELVATGALHESSLLLKPLTKFERWVEQRADVIVAQSTLRRTEFIKAGHSEDRICLVEDVPELDMLWLDDDQIDRDLEAWLKPKNEKLLIYSGGMETYQGVDYLVEGFSRLSKSRDDVRLVLFGRPLEAYRELVEKMGLTDRVCFVDHEPFERLPQYLKIADVGFALRLYDGNVPGKLPIYMASGIPVIGTDTLGINTVITDSQTGLLVPVDDLDCLVGKIDSLLDQPDFAKTLGMNGRREALRRYSPEDVRKQLGALYAKLQAT